MFNRIINLLPLGATALSVLFCDRALANIVTDYQDDLGQVTNVNQLRDVAPTDWAYEALRSLVDRYGCIVGYPNQTYRGSQPLTRYEFAAGLNSCLNQIERLIASSESVSAEDLATIERLSQEFAAELATIGGRVDELESRTAVLEDNAFSTTTKLNAEIINYILGTFGDEKPDGTNVDDEITFSSRIRLNFDTSFTGEDRLRVRLQARNVVSPAESGGTNSLALNFEGNNDNDLEIDDLHYSFPITEKIYGFAGTNGVDVDDVFNVVPTMGIAYDTLSLFSAYNNLIYDNGNGGGAALGLNIGLLEQLSIGGYFGYTTASTIDDNADADLLNWSAYATLSDLLTEGSALVVSFGQPPTLTDSEGDAVAEDPDTPYLLNVEYQYNLNDFIQLTPGGYALFNPNGDSDNDTIYVGALRTIF